MLRLLLSISLCSLSLFVSSQVKTLVAVKVQQAPVIDGELNDEVWKKAPVATNFIQYSPNYGKAPSVKTEVRILYDNSAIYIGAYLYDDPSLIRQQITSRDGESLQDVDFFSVFLDTYNDQQNGYQFLVTPSNVQTDAKLLSSPNVGYNSFGDRNWDAVWLSKTSIRKNGWIVEMKIPYISIRFAKKDVQTWGVQFLRYIRRKNESSFWNNVNPNVSGFANQFGKFTNLTNLQPPLRLSFSPYLSGGMRVNPVGVDQRTQWLHNGGMDVKYGINESFTLDATLIPDFGEVVSDNVTNNLTPYEIKYAENRPFFTEGSELFNKAGLFYSRRIGAVPAYYDSLNSFVNNNSSRYDLISNPPLVQLYNAIKISGRTRKKLGIGFFNAVTAPMSADLRNIYTKNDSLIQTEPLANYNILVLDQALKGRSSITFTNTNVVRSGTERGANVSSLDWSIFDRTNTYQINGTARYSHIFNYTPYTGAINLANDTITRGGRVYVKPYDGYNTTLRLSKVSGKIQALLSGNITSDKYDPNDLGYLQTPDVVNANASISYNQVTSTEHFISYRYSLNSQNIWFYKPFSYSSVEFWAEAFWLRRSWWDMTIDLGMQPYGSHDYFELRTPGVFMKRPAFYYASIRGSSDSRKRLYFSYSAGYTKTNVDDGNYYMLSTGLRYRFSNRFSLELDLTRDVDETQIGYAFLREANGSPIAAYRSNLEFTSVLSGVYNFTPRLNLTLRTRHYWNEVNYKNFFDVNNDGELIARPFIAGQDENYNLFNTDAFLTWDFGLGNQLVLAWKNWLGNPYGVTTYKNYLNNLNDIFAQSHGNQLSLKVIFFLDYNQLRKSRQNNITDRRGSINNDY